MIRGRLVVFLRHFGCTFCREVLQDLVRLKDELATKGKVLVLVHMGNEEEADAWQMPGIFLYHKGRIRKKFIHCSAADVPDYRSFIAGEVG